MLKDRGTPQGKPQGKQHTRCCDPGRILRCQYSEKSSETGKTGMVCIYCCKFEKQSKVCSFGYAKAV